MTTATAAPPDAIRVYDWSDQDGQPVRSFEGPSWSLDGGEIVVSVEGEQSPEGVTRKVYVAGPLSLFANEVIELAGILRDAHAAIAGSK
jgi:hypothetical protein